MAELADDIVESNALPLPLTRLISERPLSSVLPLTLNRRLGTLDGIDIGGGIDPVDPVDPKRRMNGVVNCLSSVTTTARALTDCKVWINKGRVVANEHQALYSPALSITQCYQMQVRDFILLSNCASLTFTYVRLLSSCTFNNYLNYTLLTNCSSFNLDPTIGYESCAKVMSATPVHYQHCKFLPLQPVINYSTSLSSSNKAAHVSICKITKVSPAVQVPCRYYPIPDKPPDKPDSVCAIRPPSSALPLRMVRAAGNHLASALPLPMVCWDKTPALTIPSLETYIMHNIITATIGGIAVDPLSFSIKTDMNSYCWSGGVGISPDDYDKIEHKIGLPRGQEPIINVMINELQFAILAEKPTRTRSFGQTTHNLNGRSVTARLGADYASASDKLFNLDNYASQIVGEQLQDLPFTIESFEVADWLIPASTYSVSNKTPIAVISEIADAAGGFVESHPFDAKLRIKKRWKVNAWNMATSTPDVIIPADVIVLTDDSTEQNTRFNTVMLVGSVGHGVYRALQGKDMPAPTRDNALYTDQAVTVPAGTAILSDSGTHGIYTLKMPMVEGLQLATLGDIWQVNDVGGAWLAVVTGIAIDVQLDNDAPKVYQTLNVDRYLDN